MEAPRSTTLVPCLCLYLHLSKTEIRLHLVFNMAASVVSHQPTTNDFSGAKKAAQGTAGLDEAPQYNFASVKSVWDHYLQYRPAYPDSMWHMWLDYHRGPLKTIHEVGSGCGVGMANILRVAKARGTPIPNAVLSDPSESNITTCKQVLLPDSSLCAADTAGTTLTFVQSPAETCTLPPESVDMVFGCECLHWTRIEEALARMHESLRPGGTVAAVYYDVAGDLLHHADNPRASLALQMVYCDMFSGRYPPKWGSMEPWQRRNAHLGLNFIPFDPDMWEDVRRVYINMPGGRKTTEWPIIDVYKAQKVTSEGDSRVKEETETCEWMEDKEGWVIQDCTTEWVKGMLETAPVAFPSDYWKGELWREFEEAVSEKGGTFRAVWTTNYVMARKKQ